MSEQHQKTRMDIQIDVRRDDLDSDALVPGENWEATQADALCASSGGSAFWLRPLNEETYRKLLDANIGMNPDGIDGQGLYPTINFNAPTITNTKYNPKLRQRYRAIWTALRGCAIKDPFEAPPHYPYPIGNPDELWP